MAGWDGFPPHVTPNVPLRVGSMSPKLFPIMGGRWLACLLPYCVKRTTRTGLPWPNLRHRACWP